MLQGSSSTVTVLGKRKTRGNLVLHLSGASGTDSASEYELQPTAGPSRAPILINGKVVAGTTRRYQCTYDGCDKAYTKPSRLEEHERSHTGLRPYVCATCSKSYLRETHLQAHNRSHLPKSDRPFTCEEPDCDKRFWTVQHLKAHQDVIHKGEKPFKCTAADCIAAFLKHHQLRSHLASEHAPAGTKPYQCEHPGCTKSFATNQKLHTHAKVHGEKRYTCVHPSCISSTEFYTTWTALQHHIRTGHPPTCPHDSCGGKAFGSQKGLRAHLKLHEQREVEAAVLLDDDASSADEEEQPLKRRRGGEIGRDWKCEEEGCTKDFKSKKALATHHAITHLGRRDFVCPEPTCGRAFGYKHLLQRHAARLHRTDPSGGEEGEGQHADVEQPQAAASGIDAMTGKAYAERSGGRRLALACPHPEFKNLKVTLPELSDGEERWKDTEPCEYVFGRAYDLRRHVRAIHGIILDKEAVDTWAKMYRV
ncbi:hypothetical protein BV25DRAFT_1879591 [Artomyces pyxidatus]|uniref:Uncharacterized protein n=1 Tax=Artomyces pyxidatus TaxID=48021 RepID=A0ACB8TBP4_9AGAM|nr:hypothetical protein BV25DRAFT_1879591 [Artomyces pyxidatus]